MACNCPKHQALRRERSDYLRGRAEARRKLGYSDLDEDLDGEAPAQRVFLAKLNELNQRERAEAERREIAAKRDNAVTASCNAEVKRDPPPIAMGTEAACQGCGIAEFSPIGAGPFENGLCRYCSALNAYVPIKPSLARQAKPIPIIPLEPKRPQLLSNRAFVVTLVGVITIVYLLGLLLGR